jgi:hypothetical protein
VTCPSERFDINLDISLRADPYEQNYNANSIGLCDVEVSQNSSLTKPFKVWGNFKLEFEASSVLAPTQLEGICDGLGRIAQIILNRKPDEIGPIVSGGFFK